MNLYSYLDHSKKSLVEVIQFVCEAENILEADKLATAAGFNPMKLSMAGGIRIIFLFDVKSFKLWSEETVKVEAKLAGQECDYDLATLNEMDAKHPGWEKEVVKPAKYYLNLPGWYYKNEEFVSNIANSKQEAIAQNAALVKQYMWNSDVRIFWEMPYGQHKIRITPTSGEIRELVQNL